MIVLLPCYSLEDFSIYRAEEEAGEIFSAFSAAYHPALIEALGKTPRWERAGNPTANIPHRLVIIPPCCESKVPRQWLKNAEESGAVIVRDKSTRGEIAAEALEKLGASPEGFDQDDVETFYALGYCHLASELISRKLRYMSNLDTQNFFKKIEEAVPRLRAGERDRYEKAIRRAFELLAESKTYFFPTASRIVELTWLDRQSFDALGAMLTRRRRRGESTNLVLSTRQAAWLEEEAPEVMALLREEIAARRVRVVGGDINEAPLYLLPPEVIARRLLDAHRFYAEKLGTVPTLYGRLSAGFSPLLGEILPLCGYRGALFFPRDGWRPNKETQSRIDWPGAGPNRLALLSRNPLSAESHKTFMEFSDKVGYNASSDYAQTIVLEHRPGRERPWLADMARMNRFAKVLGEVTDLEKYFDATKSTAYRKEWGFDQFKTNFLTRAVKENRPCPVGLWPRYFRLQKEMARGTAAVLFAALSVKERSFAALPRLDQLSEKGTVLEQTEEALESVLFRPLSQELDFGPEDQADPNAQAGQKEKFAQAAQKAEEQMQAALRRLAELPSEEQRHKIFDPSLAELLHGALCEEGAAGRGDFYANLTPLSRTRAIARPGDIPEQIAPLLRRRGEETILTLPPYSAVWLAEGTVAPSEPAETNETADEPRQPKRVSLWRRLTGKGTPDKQRPAAMANHRRERFSDGTPDNFYTIRNRFFEMKIDEATGQVRSIKTFSAPSVRTGGGILRQPAMGNRLAWQPAYRLGGAQLQADSRPENAPGYGYSIAAADSIEILAEGPPRAVVRITGRLCLPDGSKAAAFRETITVAEGEPFIDVELTIDPETTLPAGRPWENYYGVRFAWNDTLATVFSGVGGRLWRTDRDYLQAPECVDIQSDKSIRLSIFPRGLPFFRRWGMRQMDMVLIPKGETERSFRFRVGIDLEDPAAEARRSLEPAMLHLSGVPATRRGLINFLNIEPAAVRAALLENGGSAQEGGEQPEQTPSTDDTIGAIRLVLHETSGKETRAEITTPFPLRAARRTDLLAQPIENAPITLTQNDTGGSTVKVTLPPGAIAPLLLELG